MRSCVDGLCKLDIYIQRRSDLRGNCRVEMCDSAGYGVDSIKDRTETDVDCGGTYCDPCADEQGCKGGSDCVSNVCFAGK
ncbi:hypothetical protein WMF18_27345 [Sorangium sp. So ce315]|uniref:hypothetical protein n=1 Tax=Sorangium sp. So ce315 TaxID=3133299 RepID=UPI003F637AD5